MCQPSREKKGVLPRTSHRTWAIILVSPIGEGRVVMAGGGQRLVLGKVTQERPQGPPNVLSFREKPGAYSLGREERAERKGQKRLQDR